MDALFETHLSAATEQPTFTVVESIDLPLPPPQRTVVDLSSRRTDPETSQKASRTVKRGSGCDAILRALLAGAATDNTIEARILADTGCKVPVHKRRPEAEARGFVAFTGLTDTNASGLEARVYEITAAGRFAIASQPKPPRAA